MQKAIMFGQQFLSQGQRPYAGLLAAATAAQRQSMVRKRRSPARTLCSLCAHTLGGLDQECIAAAAAERKKQKSLVTEPTVAFKVCGHCKQRKVGPGPAPCRVLMTSPQAHHRPCRRGPQLYAEQHSDPCVPGAQAASEFHRTRTRSDGLSSSCKVRVYDFEPLPDTIFRRRRHARAMAVKHVRCTKAATPYKHADI